MIFKDLFLNPSLDLNSEDLFYLSNFKSLFENKILATEEYLFLLNLPEKAIFNRKDPAENFVDYKNNSFFINFYDKEVADNCKNKYLPKNNVCGSLCVINRDFQTVVQILDQSIISAFPENKRQNISSSKSGDLFYEGKKFLSCSNVILKQGTNRAVLIGFFFLLHQDKEDQGFLDSYSSQNKYQSLDSFELNVEEILQKIKINLYNNYMYNFAYKERTPEETVKICKTILADLGFSFREDFEKTADNLYNLNIIEKTCLAGSNGKGSTPEYTYASGYAEFLERLSNTFFFQGWKAADTFARFPDESYQDFFKILKEYPDLLEDLNKLFFLGNQRNPVNVEELLSFFKDRCGVQDKILSVPVYSVATQRERIFPIEVLREVQYTTGMCAGNTPEEAIAQGICEILERWATFYAWTAGLTPPEIPREYIKQNFPEQFSQMEAIESKNEDFIIRVYDYSFGEELQLPVIGIMLLDLKNNRFRLQFGAHSLFQVALERCLTELVQGYDPSDEVNNILNLTPVKAEIEYPWYTIGNLHRQLDFAIGRTPLSLFTELPSWEFKPWSVLEEFSNKRALEDLVRKVSRIAPDIYIRDNSYFGFNCYYIYIPGISILPFPRTYSEKDTEIFKDILYDFPGSYLYLSDEDKKATADYLAMMPDAFPFVSNVSKHPDLLFKVAVLAENNLYSDALALKDHFPENSPYKIVFTYLSLRCKGFDFSQSLRFLSTFFKPEEVLEFKKLWKDNIVENVLEDSGWTPTLDGDLIADPNFSFKKIHEKMKENIPVQSKLAEIFK